MVSSLSFVLLLHSDIHLKPIGGISLCIIYTFRSTIPQLMPTTMTTMMMMNSFCYTHIVELSRVELKVEVLSRTSISSLWAIRLMRVNPLKFQDFRHSIRPIFSVHAMCVHAFRSMLYWSRTMVELLKKKGIRVFFIINIYVYLKCCDMFFYQLSLLLLLFRFHFCLDSHIVLNILLHCYDHQPFFLHSYSVHSTDRAYGIRMFTK